MSPQQRLLFAIPAVIIALVLVNALETVFDSEQIVVILNVTLVVIGVGGSVGYFLLDRRLRKAHDNVERLMPDYGGARFTSVGLLELWDQLDVLLDPAEPAPPIALDERFVVTLTPKLLCFLREGKRGGRGESLLMLPASYIVAIEKTESTIETSGTVGPAVSIAFLGAGLRGVLTLAVLPPRDTEALVDELRGYLTTAR